MIERKIEVKTFIVHADCKCGGEYKATGEAYMCYPAKYIHVCDKCGDHMTSRDTYPKMVTEPVNADN